MTRDPDMTEVISPSDEYHRTENLTHLYEKLLTDRTFEVGDDVRRFLLGFVTEDFRQAALVGLILRQLKEVKKKAVYARTFCGLILTNFPDLKHAVIRMMPENRSPAEVYDDIMMITLRGDPHSVDYHYAFMVLSKFDADDLRDKFEDYRD